jgi:acyl transferase domain-containing protein
MGALPAGGTMASVLGLVPAVADAVARRAGAETELPLVVALVNGPETVVFSGAAAAVDRAVALASAAGGRVARLDVSHAFHSPLMEPAFAEWRAVVDAQPLRDPSVPLLSDLTGDPLTRAADLRELLAVQLVTPVRWDLVGERLRRVGAHDCIEAGDSKTLRALARAFPELSVSSLAQPEVLAQLRRPAVAV